MQMLPQITLSPLVLDDLVPTILPAQTRQMTPDEEQLVELAREGDAAACHALLDYVEIPVRKIARWYCRTYQWVNPSLDWQDLFQDAYEEMIKGLGKALIVDNPIAYLIGIGRVHMRRTCYHMEEAHESLDAFVPGYEDTCLGDLIPDSVRPVSAYAVDKNYQHVYRYI